MNGFVEGNQVDLLENGTAFFPALEAAFEGAEREIHLETYIFEPDGTGRRIASALSRAAQRGVAVRVLVDGFGARSFIGSLLPVLEAAGVSVLVYRRELAAFALKRHRLRRLHRKLATIDGRIAFIGGINIVDDLEPGGPLHPRFDYAVRVEGPLLEPVLESTRRLWWLVSWASLRKRRALPGTVKAVLLPAGRVRAAFLIRDNLRHRRDIEEAYLQALDGARDEVVVACAYFFPGRRFRKALVEAVTRGVRVTLLLQGLSDHPVLAYATRALYPYLLGRGIRLFEYHRSYLHAKVAVIDAHWATVGSSNIDPFSLLLAREANIVVDDREFASQLRSSLEEAMRKGAAELRADDWQRLPRLQRLASWLAYQLVRLAIGIAGYRGVH
ncbi:MAG: cardiolipin synthase ClsB [Rhodocyclaceae bacterium]|nr:cardiolipin synthase ClsB [Rhodocyclaceae bacterium]